VTVSTLIDTVHAYRELGLSIIPIVPGAKNPGVEWKPFQSRLATDEEVMAWYNRGGFGVGIVTGTVSGNLVVLDFEDRVLFDDFLDANPDLAMSTLCAYTGKGGHVYIRTGYPVASMMMGSGHPWLKQHKLEISSEGRYVVAPPSTHPNGRQYRLRKGSPVEIARIADPVEFLHEAFDAINLSFPIEVIQPFSEGEGDRVRTRNGAGAGGDTIPPGWERYTGVTASTGAIVDRTVGDETIDGEWHATVTRIVGQLARDRAPMAVIRAYMEQARSSSSYGSGKNRAFEQQFHALLKDAEKWRAKAVQEFGDPYDASGTPTAPPPVTAESLAERRVLLGQWVDGETPPTDWVIPDVLIRSHVHLLYGEPGCGKTIIGLSYLAQLVQDGQNVLLVDEESGIQMTALRLKAMGVAGAALDKHLHYFPFAGLTLEDADALVAYVLDVQPAMVIFDSMADVLSASRLDENAGPDVTRWMMGVAVRLARECNTAVAILDHSTKDGANKAYSRGSGAKKAKSDVAWYVEKQSDFSASEMGQIALMRTKNRVGIMPERVVYEVGGRDGELVCKPMDILQRVVSALGPSAVKALHIIELEGGEWTNQRLREAWTTDGAAPIGPERARQFLAELAFAGKIQKEGNKRQTTYTLAYPNTQIYPNSIPTLGIAESQFYPNSQGEPPVGGSLGLGIGIGGDSLGHTQEHEEIDDDEDFEYLR